MYAQNYGMALMGKTAKAIVELASGEEKNYFLKVGSHRNDGYEIADVNLSGRYVGWHGEAFV